jgi:hypothetical protein
MKFLVASAVIGPLMLMGALPAAAGRSMTYGAPIQLAAAGDSSLDRDTYEKRARDDVQEWRQKLSKFSEKAKVKGQEEGTAVESDLNKAWAKTEAEAQKLQTATTEDWQSAKVSYESAAHELAVDWDKIRDRDK